ncbi:hypothetical protein ISN44_As11g034260 [Arabidopsis suecica]|uniref:Uncharacterized protein n=1 Tax=Arabidopsis suecica TaxID=45249 RepID=A0A8T1ZE11_ARASU|nr:hypothetical protein ISN44_As11g034260 [Arabidopsis suecica]
MHHLVSRSENNPVARRSNGPQRLNNSHNHRRKEDPPHKEDTKAKRCRSLEMVPKPSSNHETLKNNRTSMAEHSLPPCEETHRRQQRGRRRSPPRLPARSAANGEAEEADLGLCFLLWSGEKIIAARQSHAREFSLTTEIFLSRARVFFNSRRGPWSSGISFSQMSVRGLKFESLCHHGGTELLQIKIPPYE